MLKSDTCSTCLTLCSGLATSARLCGSCCMHGDWVQQSYWQLASTQMVRQEGDSQTAGYSLTCKHGTFVTL